MVSFGEVMHTHPPLTLEEAKDKLKSVVYTKAGFAPTLGIVIIKTSGGFYFRGPEMNTFYLVPEQRVHIPSGGHLRPDGTLEEEDLLPIT